MDDTEMLLRFFEFDRWANQESLHSLETMRDPPQRAVALLAHIAATQRVWLERALSLPQSVAVWPQWSLSETAKELPIVLGEWIRLIATDDLSREFAYTNTKGQEFSNRLSDVAAARRFSRRLPPRTNRRARAAARRRARLYRLHPGREDASS